VFAVSIIADSFVLRSTRKLKKKLPWTIGCEGVRVVKALLCVMLLGYTAPSYICAQQAQDSDARSKIIALENVWNQAVEIKDLKALDSILDDAFVYVESDGRVLTKTEVLADVKASQGLQPTSESMVVHLHGDTAIVTGIYLTRIAEHGKHFVRRERFVDSWRQTRGVWLSIASLTTPIQ
jgi:ketosteroid isomerase-like protein